MKVRNKCMLMSGFVFLLINVASSYKYFRESYTHFSLLIVLAFLLLVTGLYVLIFKRLELLNQLVNQLSEKNTLNKHLVIGGQDEIQQIATKFNQVLDTLFSSRLQYEDHLKAKTQDLIQANSQLQQEILEKRSSERKENILSTGIQEAQQALLNPIFFNEILNKTLNFSKRRKKIFSLLLIALSYPHHSNLDKETQSYLEKQWSLSLGQALRLEDVIARTQNGEFIVLLNDIGKPKFASTVAEKIIQHCSKPLEFKQQLIPIRINIGIGVYPHDGESLEELLKNIDAALYQAKCSLKNNYQFYTSSLDQEAQEYLQLDTELRQAIQNKELALYYQPKFSIKKGYMTAVEALIRWEHPRLGLISPDKFLAIAEDSGMIIEIGEWAVREACSMNQYWQNEGYEHLTVSLNLSPKQFTDTRLPTMINQILQETGLNPMYLELEITEKSVMDQIEQANAILTELKKIGVQLSLDHFGTGYTSICHLKQFPINAIKIDKSFIKGIPNNPNDIAIINALISLTHHLGFEVIAEGVETAEQIQHLSAQECDMVQGYYLSHPLPADKIILQFRKLADEVLF